MRRRAVIILLAAAACYSPAFEEGVPCGPGGACPTHQHCDPATLRCVRELGVHDAGNDAPSSPEDAAVDAPADATTSDFVDPFSRPDDEAIGNGWIEKNPAAFAVAGGEVTRSPTALSYQDNLVYRPASEDVLDVEASIEFRLLQTPPRFPQIFVRARSATIGTAGSYDGYLLYINGILDNEAILGRQLGTPFVETLAAITLSEALTTATRYRLVLRAQGTLPVALVARVEKLSGATWVVLGTASIVDDADVRITEPGTVGFSGDEQAVWVYDNFRRTAL